MSLLLVVLLSVWSVLVNAQVFNGTHHQLPAMLENTCGVMHIDRSTWILRFRFHNYCSMTEAEQKNALVYWQNLRDWSEELLKKVFKDYNWNMFAHFNTDFYRKCSFPRKYESLIATDRGNYPISPIVGDHRTIIGVILPRTKDELRSIAEVAQETYENIIRTKYRGGTRFKSAITMVISDKYTDKLKELLDANSEFNDDLFIEYPDYNAARFPNINNFISTVACNPSHLGAVPFVTRNATSGEKSM